MLYHSKTNDLQKKIKLYDNFFSQHFFLRRLWFVLYRYFFFQCYVCLYLRISFFLCFFQSFTFVKLFTLIYILLRNKLLIRMLRFHMTKYNYYSMHAKSANVFMVKGRLPLI